jgi:AcrR family transcriptional regulator
MARKSSAQPKAQRNGAMTRQRILLVAERLFAREGFDGASVRDITKAARGDVGLVNYHFGSKEGLFRAVLLMRANDINRQRHELLAGLKVRVGDEECLRRVLHAFLLPITGSTPGGTRKLANYRRLIVIVLNSKIWQESVFKEHYDEITRELAEKIRLILPSLDTATLYWCVAFFLGSMAKAVAQLGEIEALSEGACRSGDLLQVRAEVVEFAVGAMLHAARAQA